MKTKFKSKKFEWVKEELKDLLIRLHEGNYHQTAEIIFDNVAHTGVETDIEKSLKFKPTLKDFLKSE